ncbi:L10-interacting MYB domain-containing protein [Camellia lanceoleosa]|uniref:L10-interacting MYB domain-containing protein n=1 Tax=Camellia lanceoleosa TaxID=1840588 RepID=A0ACC0HML0_9ERIC|nr:L10-interacting MYB domain-containing protein [Camellia lanceoleosa]
MCRKKGWLLWNNLLSGETCLGCDTLTGAISAFDEWWTKKLERYPDAAKFRRMSLQFTEDLDMLFSDATATGEWLYTPSSKVMLHTNETLEEFHTPHDAEFHDDTDLEVVHPSDLNKKSSLTTLTQTSSRYPSIAECLAKLESIPDVSLDDELYVWATRLLLRDKRQKCFMTLPIDEVRLRFLKLEIEMEKTTTGYRG